jgi:ankyrin repeat protein
LDSIDSYKDETKIAVQGHNKGSKVQTIVEVLRCEFSRPVSTTEGDHGLRPTKQWSPLHYAAYHNREAALLHFLRAGQSPDGNAASQNTPLLAAATAGHLNIVKALCAAGADVNATTEKNGETALHIAIKSGHYDITNELLLYRPDLEMRTSSGQEAPLHYAAAKTGSLAAVVALLKSGANIEALDTQGRTPAELAISNQNIHVAVAIVSQARGKRKKLEKEKEMLLRHVEKAQNRFSMNNELIADIFEASCEPGSTVLIEAIKRNDAGLVEMFLDKGADPNRPTSRGSRPIFIALSCCGAQIVRLLVKHGSDVKARDSEGLNVLQAAFESPSSHDQEAILGIFEALLSAGADTKVGYKDGKTLLHYAVAPPLRHSKIAQRLLECGVKVNETDKLGSSALHYASQSKSCVEILLKHRANAGLTNYDGLTPLLLALTTLTKDEEPDLEPLIKASDLRVVDRNQRTALHLAAKKGLGATVRTLLKYKAETTLVDAKGRTPLLLAVLAQQWHVIPLLATQPGINCWDAAGMTALHHVVISTPKSPATWKDIATAAAVFCEKGVSRSMRDRKGATPLIAAVKTLPEEGIAVVESLLAEAERGRGNCIGHENHQQRSALYFAAKLEKPGFVQMLLKNGAPFELKDWTPGKARIQPTTPAHKKTQKLLAEHEWLRRARLLHRSSRSESTASIVPDILPQSELKELLAMGLDPNALPTFSNGGIPGSLLWIVIDLAVAKPPLPEQYSQDILKLMLEHGADPNVLSHMTRNISSTGGGQRKLQCHPITFILEQQPKIDIDVISLFLEYGANLSTGSSYYEGRHPLHSAVKANRLDLVDEFLTRRASRNPTNDKQQTPLFIAAQLGFWEVVDLLLSEGAKVDVKDAVGNTPLHIAAIAGSSRIISCLLRAGARASVNNNNRMTPLACIPEKMEDREKTRIVKMLKNAEEQEQREKDKEKRRLAEEAKREGHERMKKEKEQGRQMPFMSTREKGVPRSIAHLVPQPIPSPTLGPPIPTKKASPPPLVKNNSSNSVHAPPPNMQKPLPTPRIDSGFGQARPSATEKPLPTLDRNKTTFDGRNETVKKEDEGELADWLAMSKLLERL